MKEVCACSASFEYTRPRDGVWDTSAAERLLLDWRANHRHEFPPTVEQLEMEQPLIHESGSSHERAIPEWGEEGYRAVGFARV